MEASGYSRWLDDLILDVDCIDTADSTSMSSSNRAPPDGRICSGSSSSWRTSDATPWSLMKATPADLCRAIEQDLSLEQQHPTATAIVDSHLSSLQRVLAVGVDDAPPWSAGLDPSTSLSQVQHNSPWQPQPRQLASISDDGSQLQQSAWCSPQQQLQRLVSISSSSLMHAGSVGQVQEQQQQQQEQCSMVPAIPRHIPAHMQQQSAFVAMPVQMPSLHRSSLQGAACTPAAAAAAAAAIFMADSDMAQYLGSSWSPESAATPESHGNAAASATGRVLGTVAGAELAESSAQYVQQQAAAATNAQGGWADPVLSASAEPSTSAAAAHVHAAVPGIMVQEWPGPNWCSFPEPLPRSFSVVHNAFHHSFMETLATLPASAAVAGHHSCDRSMSLEFQCMEDTCDRLMRSISEPLPSSCQGPSRLQPGNEKLQQRAPRRPLFFKAPAEKQHSAKARTSAGSSARSSTKDAQALFAKLTKAIPTKGLNLSNKVSTASNTLTKQQLRQQQQEERKKQYEEMLKVLDTQLKKSHSTGRRKTCQHAKCIPNGLGLSN